MPVPLIAAGISAAASAYGAHKASSSAKKAQQAQQAATDKAIPALTAANQPYMDLGKQAAGNLGSMIGNPQPYTQQFGGPQRSSGFQAFQPPGQQAQGPPPGSLGAMAGPPQAPPPPGMGQPPMAAQGAPQGQQGPMVKLQAPTGEVMPFPANHPKIQQLLSAGARMVG